MTEAPRSPGQRELPHLATFVLAAERGSFTAAAVDLGVTQAAVSQRIAALERELRLSLFSRRAGRIALTGPGERLYDLAKRIFALHEEARAMIGVQPSIAGELPIASSSAPAECCLPSLLASFHEKYPEVRIRASVSDSQSVMRAVEKGLAVLGLAGGATESSGLKSEVIGGDTLVLILAPKHRFVGRRSISLSELAREPLILREQGSGTRCTLQRALQTAGMPIDEMNIAFEVGSLGAIKVAVGRGLGVSFVSRSTVIRELAAGELASVPVSGLDLTRSIYVIRHARRPLSPAAAAFLHFLKANPPGLDRR